MGAITVFRASSLPAYLDCQARASAHAMPNTFLLHGHELAPQRGNVGALVGSGLHGAGEVGLKEKMGAGTIAAISTLADAAVEAFDGRWREESEQSAEIIMDGETPDADTARRQLVRMAAAYREGVLRDAQPLVVESRITADFAEGVILSGQSDLLHLDEAAGHINRVRDLKTGRRKQPAMKHAAQIGAYSLLFRSRGLETGAAQIDYIKREAIKKAQPPVESDAISIEAAEAMAHSVLTDWTTKAKAFEADGDPHRFMVNPTSLLCNPKFCRLHGKSACPATRTS